jgi:hypothetical protein
MKKSNKMKKRVKRDGVTSNNKVIGNLPSRLFDKEEFKVLEERELEDIRLIMNNIGS